MERVTSTKGLDLIKEFEGFQSHPYFCPSGYMTIGYGHVMTNSSFIASVTRSEALILLKEDCRIAEKYINQLDKDYGIRLNQDQFDALVSLIFNVGVNRFSSFKCCTLLKEKKLRDCLIQWHDIVRGSKIDPKTGKKEILPGLVKRREKEIRLFNGEERFLSDEEIKKLFIKFTSP